LGQIGLLGQQVGSPVSHHRGFDQGHQRIRVEKVGDHPGLALILISVSGVISGPGLDQPREPRLHAVKDLSVGQPLPLFPTPRLRADELLGPLGQIVGHHQFATGKDLHLGPVQG